MGGEHRGLAARLRVSGEGTDMERGLTGLGFSPTGKTGRDSTDDIVCKAPLSSTAELLSCSGLLENWSVCPRN